MNIDATLIGKRIKEVRTSKKIPQMLLAEKCSISESYLSYIECGKKKPSLMLITKIANELDTSVDSLLEGQQNTDSGAYAKELNDLLQDCTAYEKRIIYETIHFLKSSMRQNRSLIINEVKESIKTL